MDLGLRGKVAAIGGASKGIGRATAFGLAAEGCRVAICARGQDALASTARELEEAGAEVFAMPCDMGKLEDIKRFIRGTVERFGRLDILVNNAGGPPYGLFETHNEARWQEAINVSFLSGVRCIQEALPHLRASGSGRVINIASTSIKQPIDGLILSNTTRMATAGLAKTLSRELGKTNHGEHRMPGQHAHRPPARSGARPGAERGPATRRDRRRDGTDGAAGPRRHRRGCRCPRGILAGEPAKHITGTTTSVDGGETIAVF